MLRLFVRKEIDKLKYLIFEINRILIIKNLNIIDNG